MGHRTYLSKSIENSAKGLFEANNDIPLFWLALMDVASIERVEDEWKRVWNFSEDEYEEYVETGNATTDVQISKDECLQNASDAKKYIEKNLPDKLQLFNDFVNYLILSIGEKDVLEFSIIEIANFDGLEKFISDVKKEITTIKKGNKTRRKFDSDDFNLVGYDRFICDEFKEHSKDYLIRCEQEEKDRKEREKTQNKEERKKRLKKTGERIFMTFIALILIAYGGLGLVLDRFHFSFVLSLIGGGLILYFWGLRK